MATIKFPDLNTPTVSNQPVKSESTQDQESPSAAKIFELNVVEKKIIRLLQIASETLNMLASADHEELLNDSNSTAFLSANSGLKQYDDNTKQYLQLLDEIQLSMRKQYHYLTLSGTAGFNLPVRVSVYDLDKVLDALTRAIGLVRAELTALSNMQ
ncbi:hypothetical protein H4R33_006251 [Dimargaris cristalligena]|nr:hypothetical protein H4R33_006251 [Dimargaris cristalligena]